MEMKAVKKEMLTTTQLSTIDFDMEIPYEIAEFFSVLLGLSIGTFAIGAFLPGSEIPAGTIVISPRSWDDYLLVDPNELRKGGKNVTM